MIILARIDDRLVHGQVTVGWIPILSPDRIIVISDEAASDPVQAEIMEMGVPDGIALEVVTVEEAKGRVDAVSGSGERVMLLAPSPSEYSTLAADGKLPVDEINLGGIRFSSGARELIPGIMLRPEDEESLRMLISSGIRVVIRSVPSNPPRDLSDYLKEDGTG